MDSFRSFGYICSVTDIDRTDQKSMMATAQVVTIGEVDPVGQEALALVREAAAEVRALYPESMDPDAPWPTNEPTAARGIYLVARIGDKPVASGALRPLTDSIAEVRRVFVTGAARRCGLATAILKELEACAALLGYEAVWLETGNRQLQAMALYERYGFQRIPPFGEHINDPTSICFGKAVQAAKGRTALRRETE
jgi:GNAT superfamily N-acetyltransferase